VRAVRKWTSVALVLACLLLLCPNQSSAQTDPGRIIYSKFADSVLLVFVADDKGQPVALGSAFLVEGGRIITNAHVVSAGKPFLQFGPAKVPAAIEKIDADADLATLRTEVQILQVRSRWPRHSRSPAMLCMRWGTQKDLRKVLAKALYLRGVSLPGIQYSRSAVL